MEHTTVGAWAGAFGATTAFLTTDITVPGLVA